MWGPSLSADGSTLYLGMVDTLGNEHIYAATRSDRGATFSTAVLDATINSTSADGTPFLTYDGLGIYFYSTRPGGVGERDLWFASRTSAQAAFSTPGLVGVVNSTLWDHLPWVSRDTLTMLFSSNRSGGIGSADVYLATRATAADPFLVPTRLGGTAVNSTANDDRAVMTQDGLTIYFASNRNNTTNDFDLWMATRTDGSAAFSNAVSLQVLNSAAMDLNVALSWDEQELFFSSNRSGAQEIWRSVRQCP